MTSPFDLIGMFILGVTNSADRDQTAPKEQSDLGLLCLFRSFCPDVYGVNIVQTPEEDLQKCKGDLGITCSILNNGLTILTHVCTDKSTAWIFSRQHCKA